MSMCSFCTCAVRVSHRLGATSRVVGFGYWHECERAIECKFPLYMHAATESMVKLENGCIAYRTCSGNSAMHQLSDSEQQQVMRCAKGWTASK